MKLITNIIFKKVQHHQCKEDLKLQEEELTRVTKLLNLHKQRIEKLVVECSNLQQQISVPQNDVDFVTSNTQKKSSKQEERGKEGKDDADAGYALRSDRPHLEQVKVKKNRKGRKKHLLFY